ncbi:unnamed protein product, partial [Urochloa humidicola]
EEGRRGWRRSRSRAAARLGSTPTRGYLSLPPHRAASDCRPLAAQRRCCGGGVGVGDRGGGLRGGFRSGAWPGNPGSEPPL